MKLITYKKDLKTSLPFMGLMSALTIIMFILGTYVPFTSFVLIFLMPITSTLVASLTKLKYYPIYFITTLGLALVIGLFDLNFFFNQLLPSLLIGFLFGLFIHFKLDEKLVIVLSSIILFGMQILSLVIIYYILNVNVIENVLKIFNLSDNAYFDYFILMVIYLISTLEVIITFIINKFELIKLKVYFTQLPSSNLILSISGFIIFPFMVMSIFTYLPIALVFFALSFLLFALIIYNNFHQGKYILAPMQIGVVIINYLLYIILYRKLGFPLTIFIFSLTFLTTFIIEIILKIIKKVKSKKNLQKEI